MMQEPENIYQESELHYLPAIIHTTTKGFSHAAGRKKTNIGMSFKSLISKKVIPAHMIKTVTDPHSKSTRKVVANHALFINLQNRIGYYWEQQGKSQEWIHNALKTMEFSAIFYKYATGKGIEHPQVAGFLHNVRESKCLRNRARKNLFDVPVQQLSLPFAA